jgi:hypothetical protein
MQENGAAGRQMSQKAPYSLLLTCTLKGDTWNTDIKLIKGFLTDVMMDFLEVWTSESAPMPTNK